MKGHDKANETQNSGCFWVWLIPNDTVRRNSAEMVREYMNTTESYPKEISNDVKGIIEGLKRFIPEERSMEMESEIAHLEMIDVERWNKPENRASSIMRIVKNITEKLPEKTRASREYSQFVTRVAQSLHDNAK